jgi:murein DD-endopeptidase MepM/ murein hydrolase activator NlpD
MAAFEVGSARWGIGVVLKSVAVIASVVAVAWSAGGWGSDINSGAGTKLVNAARADVAAIVKAAPAERARLAAELAQKHGIEWIEALKRFRNPELIELERALLEQTDWRVQHRALLLAEKLGDVGVLPLAWRRLESETPRLRERAAITCLLLWDAKSAKSVAGGRAKESLAALAAKEQDEHVKQALAALQRRIDGKLAPRQVSDEHLVTLPEGLKLVPFLEGMDHLAEVAPGVTLKPDGSPGGASASTLPVVSKWMTPLLGLGQEEVPGVSLQPFANPRQNGTVFHTGHDVGACLDGAGLYAIADGVVRFVHTGSDMGTLFVVEHHLSKKELVNAVYMHGGTTVFVAVGDKVACGQLLGTMGVGFSIENGGHFAHLHFGLYPGAFNVLHDYGYKPAAQGLDDWLDPAKVLPQWIAATSRE